MAHNMLGFINRLKKDVNNLMRADEKKFRARFFIHSRATRRSALQRRAKNFRARLYDAMSVCASE
jgi:hypothetical protein